jgi:hypothetical protein
LVTDLPNGLKYLGKVYGRKQLLLLPLEHISRLLKLLVMRIRNRYQLGLIFAVVELVARDHNAALNILAKALRQAGIG